MRKEEEKSRGSKNVFFLSSLLTVSSIRRCKPAIAAFASGLNRAKASLAAFLALSALALKLSSFFISATFL